MRMRRGFRTGVQRGAAVFLLCSWMGVAQAGPMGERKTILEGWRLDCVRTLAAVDGAMVPSRGHLVRANPADKDKDQPSFSGTFPWNGKTVSCTFNTYFNGPNSCTYPRFPFDRQSETTKSAETFFDVWVNYRFEQYLGYFPEALSRAGTHCRGGDPDKLETPLMIAALKACREAKSAVMPEIARQTTDLEAARAKCSAQLAPSGGAAPASGKTAAGTGQ